jgi:phage gpG-like protein
VGRKVPIQVVNIKEFNESLRKMQRAARAEALIDAVEAGARVIETNAKINVEKTFSFMSSGGLAGSIIVETSGNGNHAQSKIGPTKIYGRIQELGGLIKPVHAKMLQWWDHGEAIFAHVVHIPARPYLRPAVDEHLPEIQEAIGNTLARRISEAAAGVSK